MIGLRVVRGPDWCHGNADQGEGHIGTVVSDTGNHTCQVIWDMGGQTKCRIGEGGKFDLRILDNAPVGAKHSDTKCAECKKSILGMRWQCDVCSGQSLCTQCYVLDKHNMQHSFKRFDHSSSQGVSVAKRSTSTKLRARGIFPGAKVERGPHWEFGDQDGGKGSKGEVMDIRGYGSDVGGRNAVKVKWSNDENNVYRVGCKGKVDLKCVEEAAGFEYYRDHLPVVGQKEGLAVRPKQRNPPAPAEESKNESVFKVGDKVCVELPVEALKEVQRGHGGWSMSMSDCIGETLTIKRFIDDSTIEVEHNGRSWQFYLGAVRKVHPLNRGDIVRVISNTNKVKLLQNNHGGWDDDMQNSLGKVGRVVKIDSDGDVAVAFGQQSWVFNPACLEPAKGAKVDEMKGQQDFSASTGSAAEDLGANLGRLMAHLLVLDALQGNRVSVGPEDMVRNAAKGNVDNVRKILQMKKQLVNSTFQNLTPLMAASHEGHLDVVKVLVENGAEINATDPRNNSALLLALAGKEEDVAKYLVGKGANVNVVGMGGRTTAHVAAYEGLCGALKQLLEKGCSPNRQDSDGDTPLHDAIAKKNDRSTAILLSHPHLNLSLCNNKGFNPLQFAAFKGHDFAVERILSREPNMTNDQKTDGHSALHIAAINNHTEIANLLLLKGKANVDLQNKQNLTALHLAAHEGYYDMVKLLMQRGASLSKVDADGDTPLHVALMGKRSGDEDDLFLALLGISRRNTGEEENARFKIACLMIENGASLQARNRRGHAPLQVCRSDRVRNAVQSFAQKVRPTTPSRNRAQQLNELFSELPLPCMKCMQRMSDARLLPCNHKVVCKHCSMRCARCPMCERPVAQRVDLDGDPIVEVPCHVQ